MSQRKDPDLYPEITFIGAQLDKIKIYKAWDLHLVRQPQQVDSPEDFLIEDGSNFALILHQLQRQPVVADAMLKALKRFYEEIIAISPALSGGKIQVFLREQHLLRDIPATRLSDGTLRYLCLLAVLCHPNPPPLVCIEEPEIGLHTDILPTIAELLIDASQRKQLIVTTHSDILVSALSEVPESVLVCERMEQGTQIKRLDGQKLQDWLSKYSLGDLWRIGEIGGTRW